MVGVICVQRFLVVTIPFRSSSMLSPLRMKVVSIFVYVANILLFSPAYFSFTHDYDFSQRYGDFIPVLKPTNFYKNNYAAINIHLGIVYNIAVLGTSLLLTLVLTPATAIYLWMLINRRKKLTQRKCSFEPQVAKTLLAICSIGLVIYGPTIGYNSATIFLPQYSVLTTSYQVFLIISDCCGCVCATVNFIIYVTMSTKFRQRYKVILYRISLGKCNVTK
ncbi:somatostatin receptor type 5 [Biomphalaria glabrata]|nr:somatostatin receptor type 5 [Biomphalaria glabrata]